MYPPPLQNTQTYTLNSSHLFIYCTSHVLTILIFKNFKFILLHFLDVYNTQYRFSHFVVHVFQLNFI